ncbi:alpha/beta hydrolase [Gordonia neofelifaecis]|uniref:Putative esterase n=1 Tax=Gordonia neofelifaecis NRRL B-59395 TaxID=644548 RepID=F1YHE8_9ACTN|nr:alpha/beta hydrolase family protein [Gordonia neofelifaecis]EGD55786.1 putative esterase [Gordonia neofelifaecis NRRL B-59395]
MKTRTLAGAVAGLLALTATVVAPLAAGEVSAQTPSQIVSVVDGATPQHQVITVYSQSMEREIPLDVLRPKDTSKAAPILYLLNGAGGGEDSASWALRTNYVEFFQNKQVNVVTPLKGIFSYYTDWERDDKVLGKQKWQTFLTRELPPLLDKELKSTGKNGVAGISMSGTSVLNLAIAAPSLYEITASYSGCARTSDKVGQRYIRMVVESRGKADTRNMWGPYDGPGWRANDPYLNAEKLRGTQVYLSSNSGLPGQDESVDAGSSAAQGVALADRVVVGGAIEAATNTCTQQMAQRLAQLKIPAKVALHPQGTHSWGYWERELHSSWPMIAKAIGA